MLGFTNRFVDAHAHDESIKPPANVPVASGPTAWDDQVAGQTCILVANEALHCGTNLDHSLVNPNQMQSFGIDHWDNPFDTSRPMSIGPVESDLIIPLATVGTKIQFVSGAPTSNELPHCPRIHLTSETDWNPTQVSLGQLSSCQGNFE